MYLFFIKKNFYDGWDNMLSLIVINLVIMTVSLGLLSLIYALQQSVPLVIALIILFGIVISILTLASGEVASSAANLQHEWGAAQDRDDKLAEQRERFEPREPAKCHDYAQRQRSDERDRKDLQRRDVTLQKYAEHGGKIHSQPLTSDVASRKDLIDLVYDKDGDHRSRGSEQFEGRVVTWPVAAERSGARPASVRERAYACDLGSTQRSYEIPWSAYFSQSSLTLPSASSA